ncbi:MAG: hypothetical protein QNJ85_14000 [Gammaproteobacteria bacterium]|nr:hypothetical protein [Gammaproteobacteria bacterium]
MIKPRLGIILLLFALGDAAADDLQMIISGKALHVGGPSDLNEANYGLGLQYDFDSASSWIPLINLATLKDSNNNTSSYIGTGIKRRFRVSPVPDPLNFDAGVLGLVMKRKDYNDDRPFLGAVPFVSFGNDWGGINLTYVPAVEQEAYPFWYFQFALKVAEF